MNKTVDLVMTAAAAVILVAVNVGVLMAGKNGAIAPVENMALWGAFVALNVASILWGITLLGLQPMVVAVSYVAGGALAFIGVRNSADISVAEIITAGATYGAFGALAIGNATQKVRLAFFNKGQVPFVFIIIGLLVIDAGLNSGVSQAGPSVLVSAVALPFVVAGVGIGLVWSVLNRFGIGRKPGDVLSTVETAAIEVEAPVKKAESKKAAAKKSKPAQKAEPVKKAAPVAPVAEPVPVVAEAAPVAEPVPVVAEAAPVKAEEEFVPLAIDEDERVAAMVVEEDDEPFEVPTFDASLYASGSSSDRDGGVMVKEPEVALDVDLDAIANVLGTSDKAEEDGEPVAASQGDWLGGHLELLNKIK